MRILMFSLMLILIFILIPLSCAQEVIISVNTEDFVTSNQLTLVNFTIYPRQNYVAGYQFDIVLDTPFNITMIQERSFLYTLYGSTIFNPGSLNSSGVNNVYGAILGHYNVTVNKVAARMVVSFPQSGNVNISLKNVIVCDPEGVSLPVILINGSVLVV